MCQDGNAGRSRKRLVQGAVVLPWMASGRRGDVELDELAMGWRW
jgi:hypothetical protein